MAKTNRKARRNQEIDQKLSSQERRLNTVVDEVKRLRKEYDAHAVMHIKDDLEKKRYQGSQKPMFTYAEIAERNNTSASTVARIAEENNLSRRKGIG